MVLACPGPLLTPPPQKTPFHCGVEVTELSTNKQHTLSPVLLRHNSTPLWEPDPASVRRPLQQQAGTGNGRPERAPGSLGPVLTQTCCNTPATARLRKGSPLAMQGR